MDENRTDDGTEADPRGTVDTCRPDIVMRPGTPVMMSHDCEAMQQLVAMQAQLNRIEDLIQLLLHPIHTVSPLPLTATPHL